MQKELNLRQPFNEVGLFQLEEEIIAIKRSLGHLQQAIELIKGLAFVGSLIHIEDYVVCGHCNKKLSLDNINRIMQVLQEDKLAGDRTVL